VNWDERWYAATGKKVHPVDLSAGLERMYELTEGRDLLRRDEATWTLSRIYRADEDYLAWLLAGIVGP